MISIIIVSKENEDGINKTKKSIVCQRPELFEVIIKRYSLNNTLRRSGNIKEISGPDNGIYDAMNIATTHVTCDWICYMNAGDIFVCSIDELIKQLSDHTSSEIIYGNYRVDGVHNRKAPSIRRLRLGCVLCHQSTVIRSDVATKRYNLKYDYAADYDFFISLYTSGKSFKKLNFTIADVESGGVSDKNRLPVYKEWLEIQKRYFESNLLSSTLYLLRKFKEFAKSLFIK